MDLSYTKVPFEILYVRDMASVHQKNVNQPHVPSNLVDGMLVHSVTLSCPKPTRIPSLNMVHIETHGITATDEGSLS